MDDMKDFMFHKLTLQIVAGLTTYLVSHLVVVLASNSVQSILSHVFVNSTLKPEANEYLKAFIGSVVTIGGMTIYHFVHQKLILPHIQNQTQGENK